MNANIPTRDIIHLVGSFYWLPQQSYMDTLTEHQARHGWHFVSEQEGRDMLWLAETVLATRWGWLCRVVGGVPLDTVEGL